MMKTSNLTKERLKEFLEQSKRFDHRDLNEYREISIDFDVSVNAEGAAKVKMGDTEVVAGVKLDVGEPYRDSEDAGVLVTGAEFLGLASPDFEPGPPKFDAIELARIVDRGIRESGMIDFKKLCIKEGEKVWSIYLDIYILNDDGNLIDAAVLASLAALLNAKMPEYDEKGEFVNFGTWTKDKLPLTNKIPVTMTAYKIGDKLILDPTRMEEEASDARISLAISNDKKLLINAAQKGGIGDFSEKEVFEVIDMVVDKAKDFYPKILNLIKGK